MNKFIALAVAMAAAAANAATISGIATSVGQDGVVTVTYSLDADAIVTADFRENGVSLGGANQWSLAGDVFKLVSAGTGKITWNAAKDIPGRQLSSVTVELKAWSESDAPDYLVADLAYGSTCRLKYYPSEDFIPGGIVSNEAYRMNYLPLRKIRAKGVQWYMGTESELGRSTDGRETRHAVTLPSNYYIGVFELTHAQCAASGISIYGNYKEEYRWRFTPSNRASWDTYRGAQPPAAPGDSSVLGKLKNRTGLVVDFPTEAQWEYAARGGHSEGTWGDGSSILAAKSADSNLSKLACYKQHVYDMCDAGLFEPNDYGLYDMHGNVGEMCQDWYRNDITTLNGVCNANGAHFVDDDTTTPSGRVVRGGQYSSNPEGCRAAFRTSVVSNASKTEFGCRVMTYANLGDEVEPTSAVSGDAFALDTRTAPPAAATTDSAVNLRARQTVLTDAFPVDMLKIVGILILFH